MTGGIRRALAALALTAVAAGGATAPAAAQDGTDHAPVDRPGPALSVPPAELAASLDCPEPVPAGSAPALLIHGTNLDPEANFSWNYIPAFEAEGRTWCTVALPVAGMEDIQVAAEHVVHAIRTVAADADGPVDIVGYSQGGMIGRWALRFWPDTRPLVDDLVGLAPSNHGTVTATATCQTGCVPAYHQQRSDAAFVDALNSHQEAFAGVDYTVAYTWGDEIVTPNVGPDASSPIRGEGSVANLALQEVCPGHAADHFTIGTTDPVAYAIVVDALDHDGPADPARLDPTVCAIPFMPGVDPTTLPADVAMFLARIDEANGEAEPVDEEPPLACYVTASCGEVAAGPDPAPAPAPVAEDGRTLPATGGGAAPAVALAVVAWVAGALVRRPPAVTGRRARAVGPPPRG